jgi:putative heme transporter
VLTLAAAMLATALHHGVDWLRGHKLGRRTAIALVLGASMAAGTGLFLLVVPPAINQGRELITRSPELYQDIRASRVYRQLDRKFGLDERVTKLRQQAPERAAEAVDPAFKMLKSAISFLGAVLAVWGITVFMLFFGEHLVRAILRETTQPRRQRYERVLYKIYRAVGGYLSGLVLICGTNALITTTFLAIVGVPFFLPLGILNGLSSLVPLAGNVIMGTVIALIALSTGGVTDGLLCAGYVILYQQFENHLLAPLVYRRTVNVNPLITVIGLIAFAELAGVAGAIVAVPMLAAGQIVVRELLAYRRDLLLGQAPPSPSPGTGLIEVEQAS